MKKITFLLSFLMLLSWQGMAQFSESFEGAGTPAGWLVINNNADIEQWYFSTPGTGSANTGTQVARIDYNSSQNHDDYLVTPQINVVDQSTDRLTLYAKSRSASFLEDFNILISTTGTNVGDFSTQLTPTITAPSSWNMYQYDLSAYEGQNIYIAFQAISLNQWELYIDDVTIDGNPACPDPTALTATNITATSADLGWTDATGSLWDIEWGTTGFTPTGTPNITGTTTNPHNLTGLTAQTAYDFYVRTDCGGSGTSNWVGPFTFTTACNAFTVPFVENFNSTSTTQTCWTVINNNNDADAWNMDYTSNPLNGDEVAAMYTDINGGNNDDYLVTPTLTLTGNERLRFHYRVQSAGEPNDFQVTLSTTGVGVGNFTNTLMPLTTVSNTTYQEQIINLSAYSGNVNIAFHIPSGGLDGWRLYIDSVVVEALPACPDPTALTATNITATSADLGWTDATGSLWDIEWGTTGFTPTGTPNITGTTTNPHNLTGLTAQTAYDFYVRTDCGGSGTSNWVGPFTFTTACASFVAPYLEEFNTASLPACWSETGDNSWEFGSINGTTPAGFADYGAINVADQSAAGNGTFIGMDGSDNGNTEVSVLYSPMIDVSPLSTPHLNYWVFSNNTNDAAQNKLIVELWDGANWVLMDSIQANLGANWVNFDTDLSSLPITGDVQVRFTVTGVSNGGSTYYNDILIDDVRIFEPLPNDIGVIEIASTPAGCGLGMETVTIKVKNYGAAAQSNFDVVYALNSVAITPETVTATVNPGDTLTHVFTTLANMSTPMVYTIDAWTDLTTDGDNSNDTLNGWMTEHLASSLAFNDSAYVSNTVSSGTNTIVCTNGLVNSMLDSCYTLSAVVIDSLPHTWETDIDMWLISPAGDTLELSTDNGSGSGSDGYINVTFTDTASNSIAGATNLTNGFFTPEEVAGLAKFNGTDPNGAWTLRVIDDAGGDNGTLYAWHLEFTDHNFAVDLGADTNACSTDQITLNAGVTGSHSYSWSTGDNTQQIVIDTNSLGGNGTYNISVVVTDTLTGCQSMDTIVVNYSICTGINAQVKNVNVNVYPNPNNGEFTLNVNTNDVNELAIKVVNIQGQEVYNKMNFDNINQVNEKIDLSDNADGIYFVIVTTDKGIVTHKMIVQ